MNGLLNTSLAVEIALVLVLGVIQVGAYVGVRLASRDLKQAVNSLTSAMLFSGLPGSIASVGDRHARRLEDQHDQRRPLRAPALSRRHSLQKQRHRA
jgi:hypothetical protein